MQGLRVGVGAAEIEAEGAGALVFAVDNDDVVGVEFGCDGVGELA